MHGRASYRKMQNICTMSLLLCKDFSYATAPLPSNGKEGAACWQARGNVRFARGGWACLCRGYPHVMGAGWWRSHLEGSDPATPTVWPASGPAPSQGHRARAGTIAAITPRCRSTVINFLSRNPLLELWGGKKGWCGAPIPRWRVANSHCRRHRGCIGYK